MFSGFIEFSVFGLVGSKRLHLKSIWIPNRLPTHQQSGDINSRMVTKAVCGSMNANKMPPKKRSRTNQDATEIVSGTDPDVELL